MSAAPIRFTVVSTTKKKCVQFEERHPLEDVADVMSRAEQSIA